MRSQWQWNCLDLAINWQQLHGIATVSCNWTVNEFQESALKLLAIAPFVYLGLDQVNVTGNKIPDGVVLPRHHIVSFGQVQRRAVVAFTIAKVNKSLLSLCKCWCSDSFYYLTLLNEQVLRTIEVYRTKISKTLIWLAFEACQIISSRILVNSVCF